MNIFQKFYPEFEIDNFTHVDGTIEFYLKVKALYSSSETKPRVLDFGAGRGAWMEEEPSSTVKGIRDLRCGACEVVAADIDTAVLQNRCSDRQVIILPTEPLPFEDGSFDLIVADYVFEHVQDPGFISKELLRVVRPGGWICARTANKSGYVALMSRVVPNQLHRKTLRWIQPDRKEVDIFPTTYALSSSADINRYFKGHKIICVRRFGEPSYYFGSALAFRFFYVMHGLLPGALATGIYAFIQRSVAETATSTFNLRT